MRRLPLAALLLAVLLGAGARTVAAQAWLPPRGEAVVSLTFGDYRFDGHFDSDGSRDPFGGTHALSLLVEVGYAPTDRLALSVGLPFISTRLSGSFPRGVPLGPLDDGNFHGDFQDLRVEGRFVLWDGPVVVTPFVALGLPTGYEVVGEAVPGKGIKEALVGVNLGRALGPWLPRAYAHARYSYAVLEKALPDIGSLNRTNLDLEIGFALRPAMTLRGTASWQVTHGGLDLEDMRTRPEFFRTHDRAARTNFFNLGGGLTYDATRRLAVYGLFVKTVSGQNAHQARAMYVGLSLRFGGDRFGS